MFKPFKSELISPGLTGSDVSVNLGFIPKKWNGLHVFVDALLIRCAIQIDTAGAYTAYGARMARALKNLIVKDKYGVRVNLPGEELRVLDFADDPRHAQGNDVANILGTTNNQARSVAILVPFACRNGLRGRDTSCPAAWLEEVMLTSPAPSDLGLTGGDPTFDSLTYQITALCHLSRSAAAPARRILRSHTADQTDDLKVPIHGRWIRGLYLFKPADAVDGGTALDVDVLTCEAAGIVRLAIADLKECKLRSCEHDRASTVDPFVTTRALALAWPYRESTTRGGKLSDGWGHSGEVLINQEGNTVTQLKMIVDAIEPVAKELRAEVAASGATLEPKTASKAKLRKAVLAPFMPNRIVRRA